jgi:hypothetical protein
MDEEHAEGRVVLVEGVDYVIERGRWVFTAHYLKRRGYCCGNGCRNCPWGTEEKGTRRKEKEGWGESFK